MTIGNRVANNVYLFRDAMHEKAKLFKPFNIGVDNVLCKWTDDRNGRAKYVLYCYIAKGTMDEEAELARKAHRGLKEHLRIKVQSALDKINPNIKATINPLICDRYIEHAKTHKQTEYSFYAIVDITSPGYEPLKEESENIDRVRLGIAKHYKSQAVKFAILGTFADKCIKSDYDNKVKGSEVQTTLTYTFNDSDVSEQDLKQIVANKQNLPKIDKIFTEVVGQKADFVRLTATHIGVKSIIEVNLTFDTSLNEEGESAGTQVADVNTNPPVKDKLNRTPKEFIKILNQLYEVHSKSPSWEFYYIYKDGELVSVKASDVQEVITEEVSLVQHMRATGALINYEDMAQLLNKVQAVDYISAKISLPLDKAEEVNRLVHQAAELIDQIEIIYSAQHSTIVNKI